MDADTTNAAGTDTETNTAGHRPMTFGERAVGLAFNPGGNPKVQAIKEQFALMIDALHNERVEAQGAENMEAVRMLSIAVTKAQEAQMWAVKAVTWSV